MFTYYLLQQDMACWVERPNFPQKPTIDYGGDANTAYILVARTSDDPLLATYTEFLVADDAGKMHWIPMDDIILAAAINPRG